MQYEALYFEIYTRKLRDYSKHMLETAVFDDSLYFLQSALNVQISLKKDATNLVNLIYRFNLIGHRSEGV